MLLLIGIYTQELWSYWAAFGKVVSEGKKSISLFHWSDKTPELSEATYKA